MLFYYASHAWEAIARIIMTKHARFIVVVASLVNYCVLAFVTFMRPQAMALVMAQSMMMILVLMGFALTRPVCLLPNLIYKGVFASTLLFLGLQGAEQGTMEIHLVIWYTASAFLCLLEMHHMLNYVFHLAVAMRREESTLPTYKEVKKGDAALPTYDDAVQAQKDGTARLPPMLAPVHKVPRLSRCPSPSPVPQAHRCPLPQPQQSGAGTRPHCSSHRQNGRNEKKPPLPSYISVIMEDAEGEKREGSSSGGSANPTNAI